MSRLVHFPNDALRHATGGPVPVACPSLPADPRARLEHIGRAIERVVVDSYKDHPMQHRTSAEDMRRASICTDWFNRLVHQFRWTADKALSVMRLVLNDALTGIAPRVTDKRGAGDAFAPDHTLLLPS